ncbi:cation/H(+) antiporter 4-like [Cucurbita pepo subsp. pepo]|uniref:cation/H(+) antiporter 4-like n=1 Tax=Cucurbita pepo subsp. pepo TaxID=3664 RepID=UPI000C9D58B2|nr:cation/H(+) antiporter 4-like [Cucurbita pepo subsp. pepo]
MASNFTIYQEIMTANNGNFITLCMSFPPKASSNGIWDYVSGSSDTLRSSPLPLLECQMLIIFIIVTILHFLLHVFGIPVFVSQMIAGLILGSSWKGYSNSFDNFKEYLFPIASQDILGLLSGFGYTLFIFLVGVRMDLNAVKKSGKQPLIGGVLSVVISAIIGSIAAFSLARVDNRGELINMEFIAAAQSFTSFAVVHYLLDHLKILNSEVGRIALSTTIVADLTSLSISFIATFIRSVQIHGVLKASMSFTSTIGSIVFVLFIFRPAMLRIARSTPNGRPVNDVYIGIIVLLVFVSVSTHITIGRSAYSAPFILGLVVPEGPPLGTSLVNRLDGIITSVFVPLFVTINVMKADLSFLSYSTTFLARSMIVIIMTTVAKMIASVGTSLYFNMSSYDALAFGFIMSSKGIIELVGSSFFYDSKALTGQTYSVMVIDILFFSTLVPMLVKYVYNPSRKYTHYKRKNILNLKLDAELRILGCFHTQEDVSVLLNLLHALYPTEESPVLLYTLHLVELVGRSSPVFISHELHEQKGSSEEMISDNILQMLRKYGRSNVVSIEAFTAIVPKRLMHDDICTVAINKLTSLVILPFHRRWTREGIVESEDNAIRALNCHVLELAPCSVGILIDRGYLSSYHSFEHSNTSLLQVAMVFIGGQDDREAFSLARRMIKEMNTAQLTVIRLLAEDDSISHWETVLDTELLNDVRYSFVGGKAVRYVEMQADEGSNTAAIIRSIGDSYDLVIVGRRGGVESPQTSGLMEWNEFPELGIIGDMLASADFHCKASTLVIQQQQQCSVYGQ